MKRIKDYLIPQAVKLEYVALNIKDLADKQTVSAEEVQKAYDSKSVDLSPRAEIAHIFIPVMPNGDEASNAEIKAEVDKMAAELKEHRIRLPNWRPSIPKTCPAAIKAATWVI